MHIYNYWNMSKKIGAMVYRRINQILLILFVLAVLVWGVVSLTESPVDICIEENRTAEKVLPLEPENYMSGDFQDSLELALGDQLPYAAQIKKTYNSVFESYKAPYIRELLGANPAGITYVNIKDNISMIDDYLVYNPSSLAPSKDAIDKIIKNKNEIIEAHPELAFYAFYVEKENDIDFTTNEKSGISEYVMNGLALAEDHKDVFLLKNFEQYKSDFYKTDHHWTSFGAHRAYIQLISMLLPKEKLLNPLAIVDIGSWQGSMSKAAGLSLKEDVSIYEYELPKALKGDVYKYVNPHLDRYDGYIKRTHYLDGSLTASAVEMASFAAIKVPTASSIETMEVVSYGDLYGSDFGQIIWENKEAQNGNILVFGDSYDNALLRLLACHFKKVYSVDLRYFDTQVDEEFIFDNYIRNKDIEYVLFIGSESFWYAGQQLIDLKE